MFARFQPSDSIPQIVEGNPNAFPEMGVEDLISPEPTPELLALRKRELPTIRMLLKRADVDSHRLRMELGLDLDNLSAMQIIEVKDWARSLPAVLFRKNDRVTIIDPNYQYCGVEGTVDTVLVGDIIAVNIPAPIAQKRRTRKGMVAVPARFRPHQIRNHIPWDKVDGIHLIPPTDWRSQQNKDTGREFYVDDPNHPWFKKPVILGLWQSNTHCKIRLFQTDIMACLPYTMLARNQK